MIHTGDARTLMHHAEGFKAMITDPIWPNYGKVFTLTERPADILRQTIEALPASVERLVIVLGGDSDPRFLFESVPAEYPFLKTCFLEFVSPAHKGRNLYTHLMAYAFGKWPRSKLGARVIPTKHMSKESEKRLTWHPTPMRVSHCKWLVKWWGDGGVVDPFAGSGSFGMACRAHRLPYVGFEINEDYAARARARIEDEPEPFC